MEGEAVMAVQEAKTEGQDFLEVREVNTQGNQGPRKTRECIGSHGGHCGEAGFDSLKYRKERFSPSDLLQQVFVVNNTMKWIKDGCCIGDEWWK